MAAPRFKELKLGGWPAGIDNVSREDKIPRNALRRGVNVDITSEAGAVSRREGYQLLHAGKAHSIYGSEQGLFFVLDGDLVLSDGQGGLEVVAAGLGSNAVDYAEINGEVYYVSLVSSGVVDATGARRELGIDPPSVQPTLQAASTGGLFAGDYQVAVTFTTAAGKESGTGQAALVTVPEGGGIDLTNIPVSSNPEVNWVNIYASEANGEDLFLRDRVLAGTSSYLLGERRTKKTLDAMFKTRMPNGQFAAFYRGRFFVGAGGVLYFSDPLDFERYSVLDGYILLNQIVDSIVAVDEGIYVPVEDGVIFLSGESPTNFVLDYVSSVPVVPGTFNTVDGSYFGDNLVGSDVVVWWGKDGVFNIGSGQGQVESLAGETLAVAEFERGSVTEVVRSGARQIISSLRNPVRENALAFGDSMVIEVHKNGTII